MNQPSWLEFLRPGLDRHRIARSLFLRGMGLVYLVAILSWMVQVSVLVGENGLAPAGEFLGILKERADQLDRPPFLAVPSIFWLTGASDLALYLACGLGIVLSLLVVAGRLVAPALVLLWILYLSLVKTGSVFMNFQWDILLLEAGFLAPFLAPWNQRSRWRNPAPLRIVNRIALVFLWFLVAKLMFFSGWVKLAWSGEVHPEWWPDRTALDFHYMTQPIPTWTAWYAHHAPGWFHAISIWAMYAIELVLPFAILLGRYGRLVAAIGFAILMGMILLTGNYTYFNWLTILLCIPLVHDSRWPKFVRDRLCFVPLESVDRPSRREVVKQTLVAVPVFGLLALLQLHVVLRDLHQAPNPVLSRDATPAWLDSLANACGPFHLASGYGLFRTMTTTRPEIVLEGSADGKTWKEYDFSWKVDRLDERPRFVAPHQPRAAWQFWFAALEGPYRPGGMNSAWFERLVLGLLEGNPKVTRLLRDDPFPDEPPRVIRAYLYEYEFTTPEEKSETGEWWSRRLIGPYLQSVSLPSR